MIDRCFLLVFDNVITVDRVAASGTTKRRFMKFCCIISIAWLGLFSVGYLAIAEDQPPSIKKAQPQFQDKKDIIIEDEGHTFRFPLVLDYAGKKWNRHKRVPSYTKQSVQFVYHGDDPNEVLKYYRGFIEGGPRESFRINRRANADSPWKAHGLWRVVASDGTSSEVTYESGKAHGPFRVYYSNGKLSTTGFHDKEQKGGRYGLCQGFYPNGDLWWQGDFDEGGLVGRSGVAFDKQGNKTSGFAGDRMSELIGQWSEVVKRDHAKASE